MALADLGAVVASLDGAGDLLGVAAVYEDEGDLVLLGSSHRFQIEEPVFSGGLFGVLVYDLLEPVVVDMGELDCVGVEFGVPVVDPVDVRGVDDEFGFCGLGEEDRPVVGAGAG